MHEAIRDRQCNNLKTLFNGFDVIDSKGRESVENRAEIHRIVQCRRRGEMIVDCHLLTKPLFLLLGIKDHIFSVLIYAFFVCLFTEEIKE